MKKTLLLLTSLLIITQLSISQNALDFDGTGDFVQTTYNGVLGSNNRTFEAWIYLDTTPTRNYCIFDYGLNSSGSRNTFYITSSLSLGFLSGGTNANLSSVSNAITIKQWVHVAFVLNNGTGFLYVNGTQVGTGNLSSVNTPTGNQNLIIGQRVTGGNIAFKGSIDEVRIWDVARTLTEIASTMNSEFCTAPSSLKAYYKMNSGIAGGTNTTVTTAMDNSGANNTGTLSGFTLTGATSNWVTGKSIFPVAINSTFPITACGSFTMPNGDIITTAGTYFDTISSSSTCDSLDSYVVTLTSATIKNVITDSGCTTYTTPLGNVITTTGTYYDTISTTTICDTLIQYDIIISGAVDDSVYRQGGRVVSFDTWANHQWVRCDSNYWPIPGATGSFYNTTIPGDYGVIVTRGACSDTSDCININPASISEITLNNSFELFPNPASSFLTIKNLEDITINGITIIDVSGKTVLEEINNSNNVVDIETLENGVYFLQIKTASGIANMKFIKN